MDLSPEVVEGIALLGDGGKLGGMTDPQFDRLCQTVFKNFQHKAQPSIPEDEQLQSLDRAALKQAYGALVTLMLECARFGLATSAASAALVEHGVGTAKAQKYADYYGRNADSLSGLLKSTSFGPPRVVDVDWRADWHVRSANMEKVHEVKYLLTLRCKGGEDVQFSCSADELQDMAQKLNDAAKQIERIVEKE